MNEQRKYVNNKMSKSKKQFYATHAHDSALMITRVFKTIGTYHLHPLWPLMKHNFAIQSASNLLILSPVWHIILH